MVIWSVCDIGLYKYMCPMSPRRAGGLVPESAVPAVTRRGKLWRRFYYLQYIKLLYKRYKAEYARWVMLASTR